jgi:hypothetical protein
LPLVREVAIAPSIVQDLLASLSSLRPCKRVIPNPLVRDDTAYYLSWGEMQFDNSVYLVGAFMDPESPSTDDATVDLQLPIVRSVIQALACLAIHDTAAEQRNSKKRMESHIPTKRLLE